MKAPKTMHATAQFLITNMLPTVYYIVDIVCKVMRSSVVEKVVTFRWICTLELLRKIAVKRNPRLLFFTSLLGARFWPELWKINTAVWFLFIAGFHFALVLAEYAFITRNIQRQIDKWKGMLDASDQKPKKSAVTARPNMGTFVFKDGVDFADLGTVQRIFCSFAMKYGLAPKTAGSKKNRRKLRRAVTKMLGEANFVTEMTRKMQDYILTTRNFDEVVDDMTSLMRPFCCEESFRTFRSAIADAVKRGLHLCATSVYEDSVNVLSVTKECFFLVAFTLKIYRVEKGWIISTPVVTGKYASFVLRVSTTDFLKALDINVDAAGTVSSAVAAVNGSVSVAEAQGE
jgi:hypothetical protein